MIEFQSPTGRTVFRRDSLKTDGRRLSLYGYEAPRTPKAVDSLQGAGPGSSLRWHPLLQEWSVYAAHRQNRTFMPSKADDPLSPTREGGPVTEIEVEGFEVAVFQNRFASLHPDANETSPPPHLKGAAATGDCEVVVFTSDLTGSLATLKQERRELLVATWNDRYTYHYDRGAAFVFPFESRGREVGVTLDHPHGQIYAFPFLPHTQARMADGFASGFDLAACLPDWRTDYIIAEAGPLAAFVPPFARYPYEVWIAPRNPVRGPWELDQEGFEAFAFLLGDITARYDALYGRPAATMLGLQAAWPDAPPSFQFTAQFFPILRAGDKVKYLASVEQATQVFTVDVMPEAAAKALRDVPGL